MTTVTSVTVGAPEFVSADDPALVIHTAVDPITQFAVEGRPVKDTDLVTFRGKQMRVSAAVSLGLLQKNPYDGSVAPVSAEAFEAANAPKPGPLTSQRIEGPRSEAAAVAALQGMPSDYQRDVLIEAIQASTGEDSGVFEDDGTISRKAAKWASENNVDITKPQKALQTYMRDLHAQAVEIARAMGVQNEKAFVEYATTGSNRETLNRALLRLAYAGLPDGVQHLAATYLSTRGHADHNTKTQKTLDGKQYVEVNGRRTSPGAARLMGLIR